MRRPIFLDDTDRRRYLELLAKVIRWTEWRCLSYCLMGNHVHLLIETPKPNLGRGMQRLHGNYGYLFNQRHAGSGHVFQGRYRAELVDAERHLWATVRYVANNPVAAGLCATPEDWPWSSHTAILAEKSLPFLATWRLLSYFAANGGDAREQYHAVVKGSDPLTIV